MKHYLQFNSDRAFEILNLSIKLISEKISTNLKDLYNLWQDPDISKLISNLMKRTHFPNVKKSYERGQIFMKICLPDTTVNEVKYEKEHIASGTFNRIHLGEFNGMA